MPEDNASWYQRKMAQMRGGNAPQPFQGRAPVPQYEQPVARYQQQLPPAAHEPPAAPPETMSEFLDQQKHGKHLRPAQGARLNPDPCPGCGGNLYFEDLGKKRRGPPPAPRCFTCGYNELFEQGLEANWQGGA